MTRLRRNFHRRPTLAFAGRLRCRARDGLDLREERVGRPCDHLFGETDASKPGGPRRPFIRARTATIPDKTRVFRQRSRRFVSGASGSEHRRGPSVDDHRPSDNIARTDGSRAHYSGKTGIDQSVWPMPDRTADGASSAGRGTSPGDRSRRPPRRSPARSASVRRSSGVYLCEFSVWIDSPSANRTVRPGAGDADDLVVEADQVHLDPAEVGAVDAPGGGTGRGRSRPPSSRLIRTSRLRLNRAVTPWASS